MSRTPKTPTEGTMDPTTVSAPEPKPAPKRRTVVRKKKTEEETVVAPAIESSSAPVVPQEEIAAPLFEGELSGGKSSQRSYVEAVGRRKRAIARVRLWKGGKPSIRINDKEWNDYFRPELLQMIVSAPLKTIGQWERLELTCTVIGGGPVGQAEAVRHGISNVLLKLNPVFRKALKKAGYLTRDPREKERKKYGLRGARRAPQWQKR